MEAIQYQTLLNEVFIKKNEIRSADSKEFSNLFIQDPEFRNRFYEYFELSGASLVIADNLEKKVVLLQDQVEDARGYPILKMPVIKPATWRKSFYEGIEKLSDEEYNYLSNRIFQIQRGKQGLKRHINRVTFEEVPEFFDKLRSLGDSGSTKDYFISSKGELLYGFLLWRFFIWLLYKNWVESDRKNNPVLPRDYKSVNSIHGKKNSGNYFNSEFLKSHFPKQFPESSLEDFDMSQNWDQKLFGKSYECWTRVRKILDVPKNKFVDELSIVNSIVDEVSLEELANKIEMEKISEINETTFEKVYEHFLKENGNRISNNHVISAIELLHDEIPLILPYYYFSLIDNKIKEHFVFSLWHSKEHPIKYIKQTSNHREMAEHTSVLSCVVALNNNLSQSKRNELVTIMKLLSEQVINSVFIQRLVRSEQRGDIFQFERNILLSSTNLPGIYVLGSNEERITFLAQQSRAINLIRALYELNALIKESKVAIIGGGISGITAATACNIVGVSDITVFEKENEILFLQKNTKHRYIHPYIYDWPDDIYENQYADLPFLSWQANYADEVIKSISDAFYRDFKSEMVIHTGVPIDKNGIKSSEGKYRLFSSGEKVGEFDVVILAIGFGKEVSHIQPNQFQSYWDKDDLEKEFTEEKKIIIAGSGDGALIDLIRASLKDINTNKAITHNTVFQLSLLAPLINLGYEMLKIDRKYSVDQLLGRIKENDPSMNLKTIYDNHFIGKIELELAKEELRKYYRAETKVIHYSRRAQLLPNTSLLNRLIVYILMCDAKIQSDQYISRTIEKKRANKIFYYREKPKRKKAKIRASDLEEDICDISICRFGTDSNYLEKCFPEIKLSASSQIYARLNLTNYVSLDTKEWYKEKMGQRI